MADNEGSRPDGERRGGQGGRPGGNRGGRPHRGGGHGGHGGRDDRRGGGRGQGRPGGRGGQGGRSWESRDGRRDDRGERRGERRDDRRDDRRERRDDWREGRRDERGGGRRFDRRDGDGPGGRGGRRDDRRGGPRDGRRDDRRGGFGDGGQRRRSNRGGRDQADNRAPRTGPQRPGFREERINARMNEPKVPDDITPDELDPSVRRDLKSLSKDNADQVARHMIMAAAVMAEDPQLALKHARAAKDRAGRVGVVRETLGVAAYHAGEWKEALAELRAARRISGGPGMLAVMADCERGLGRPEKAIELGRSDEARELDEETKVELAIVVAGARRDMGDLDGALVELEAQNLDPARKDFPGARLFYAYADALVAAGREAEAREWFTNSANADPDELLDSRERLAGL